MLRAHEYTQGVGLISHKGCVRSMIDDCSKCISRDVLGGLLACSRTQHTHLNHLSPLKTPIWIFGVCGQLTILVHLVTCNWLVNCTAGVFMWFCCFYKTCDVGIHVMFERWYSFIFRPIFHLKYQNRFAPMLCTPQVRNWFQGGLGKITTKTKEGRERMDIPNFCNVTVSLFIACWPWNFALTSYFVCYCK